jgi:hypothetical protein
MFLEQVTQPNNISHILTGVAGVATIGGTAVKSIVKVKENNVGLRTHNGRGRRVTDSRFSNAKAGDLYGMVRAGYHATVPFTHGILTVSLQDRTSGIPEFNVDTDHNRQHQVQSQVTWGVMRDRDKEGNPLPIDWVGTYGRPYEELIYSAIFKTETPEELEQVVVGICRAGLRKALLDQHDLRTADAEAVQPPMTELCAPPLAEYGVELRRLHLGATAYSMADVLGHNLAASPNGQTAGALGLVANQRG